MTGPHCTQISKITAEQNPKLQAVYVRTITYVKLGHFLDPTYVVGILTLTMVIPSVCLGLITTGPHCTPTGASLGLNELSVYEYFDSTVDRF